MREAFHIPVARACRLAGFSRAAWYWPSTAKDQSALRLRIRELAMARPRFGYQRIHVLLRREGSVRCTSTTADVHSH
jgi:putative transposase